MLSGWEEVDFDDDAEGSDRCLRKSESLGDSGHNQRKHRSKRNNLFPVSSFGAVWKVKTHNICFRRSGIRTF